VSYLVDTDYLIDASAGIVSAVRTLAELADAGLAISVVSFGEIFGGAFGFPDPRRCWRRTAGSSPASR
jgi:hypothetical protein